MGVLTVHRLASFYLGPGLDGYRVQACVVYRRFIPCLLFSINWQVSQQGEAA